MTPAPDRRSLLVAGLALGTAVGTAVRAQDIVYLSQAEAMGLEHETRLTRLRRWADMFGVRAPEFSSYTVPAGALQPAFDLDVPVLRIVFPESTFFDLASDVVKPTAMAMVRAMAQTMNGDVPDVTLFVAGHADARGSTAYNHNLSIRRARAVAQLLKDLQASDRQIWSIGFGKSVPLYPNTTEVNMAFNRRVEFLLAARADAIAVWLRDQAIVTCPTANAYDRVSCMIDFQKEPVFTAVKLERTGAVFTPKAGAAVAVRPSAGRAQTVRPTAPDQIAIRLNEAPIYVRMKPQ